MDRCYFCRGNVSPKKIEHLHRWGDALLLVKGLQAEVCEECQEVYLPPESLQILDDLVAVLQPRRMTVVGDFSVRGGIKTLVTASYPK